MEFAELTQLTAAADECRQLNREAGRRLLRADGRKLSWMFGVDELENVLGSRQIFQAMHSEVAELRTRR